MARKAELPTPTTKTVPQDNAFNNSIRIARFDAVKHQLTVGDIVVPWIPCRRCKGTGQVTMGNDPLTSGIARCAPCQGKGKLTAEDVERNQAFKRARLEAGVEREKQTLQEFESLLQAQVPAV